jgi:hypothetical protein
VKGDRWGVVLVVGRRSYETLLGPDPTTAPGCLHRTFAGWQRPADLPAVTRAAPLGLGLALRWGGVLDPAGWDRARRVFVETDRNHGTRVPGAWDFHPEDRTLLSLAEALRVRGLVERVEVLEPPRG